jgi:hypothetical protein
MRRDWHAVQALPFGDGRKEGITVEFEPVLLKQLACWWLAEHHAHTSLASSTSVAREFEIILEVGLAGGVDPSHVKPHGSLRERVTV